MARSVDGGPAPRRVVLEGGLLVVVGLGGIVGTALRQVLELLLGSPGGFPAAILVANLTGAFLLGILLEVLGRRGPDEGPRRELRLLLGTGVLGGYTTFSALTVATARFLTDGHVLVGVGYALTSLVLGVAAAWAGIVVATRWPRPRVPR